MKDSQDTSAKGEGEPEDAYLRLLFRKRPYLRGAIRWRAAVGKDRRAFGIRPNKKAFVSLGMRLFQRLWRGGKPEQGS